MATQQRRVKGKADGCVCYMQLQGGSNMTDQELCFKMLCFTSKACEEQDYQYWIQSSMNYEHLDLDCIVSPLTPKCIYKDVLRCAIASIQPLNS